MANPILANCVSQATNSPVVTKSNTTDPPLEITTIRLLRSTEVCIAPQYISADFLQAEGFTQVEFVDTPGPLALHEGLASGDIDVSMGSIWPFIYRLDLGDPIVILAGIHVGCYELIGADSVRAIRDLKGKTVSAPFVNSGRHLFAASMAAHVGLDVDRDINWVFEPQTRAVDRLVAGEIDALMAFPPEPQELRARGIGHVVVNTVTDRPWSQYFCCMLAGNRTFVEKHPVATKRAMRAILKAAEFCSTEPERVARLLVEANLTQRVDYAHQALQEIPYDRWHEYSAEDTVRFFTLRLKEAGFIKNVPDRLISQGTDWRPLNELKREMKG